MTPECISATVILTLHSSFAYQWPQSYANEAHARRPGPSFLSFSLPSSSSSSSSSFIFLFFLFPFEISLKPASYITRNYRNMNKENTSSASYWLVKERKKGIQTYFDIYISIDILRNSLICILIPPSSIPHPGRLNLAGETARDADRWLHRGDRAHGTGPPPENGPGKGGGAQCDDWFLFDVLC